MSQNIVNQISKLQQKYVKVNKSAFVNPLNRGSQSPSSMRSLRSTSSRTLLKHGDKLIDTGRVAIDLSAGDAFVLPPSLKHADNRRSISVRFDGQVQTNRTQTSNKDSFMKPKKESAPSYVKFYKAEQLKDKFNRQNRRDKLRAKIHEKM